MIYNELMKYKVIFSIIATLLFIGGVAFVWNEKNLSLYKTQVSEKHMRTSLVKAQTTDPKTLAWNAANRNQRVDLPGNFSIGLFHTPRLRADGCFFKINVHI